VEAYMQAKFDKAVLADRFSLPQLQQGLEDDLTDLDSWYTLEGLLDELSARERTALVRSLLRWAFLIELVKKPKIETTKYEVRWADRLGDADPRYLSFDLCVVLFETAIRTLCSDIEAVSDRLTTLKNFLTYPLNAYEVPFDYVVRRSSPGIHRADNIAWFWSEEIRRTVGLRRGLWNPENPHKPFFEMVYAKTQVKTYLTDRVLTGGHKTNREKRWETHPESVHFALRRDCLGIERVLVEAVCHFDGFPRDLRSQLIEDGLLTEQDDCTRCPITMKPLSFEDFKGELTDPDHGRSSFQVGHLNPLKAVNDDPTSGHTAANIGWISADGNRIQGSLSLAEIRALIREIFYNYERFGIE